MQPRIWPASGPPPMASKARVAPVVDERRGEVVGERRRDGVAHVLGAGSRSSAACSGVRTMLTSGDAVGEAHPVEHLAEVRRGGGVHQRGVALAAHRADHAEGGQRVDEARRALDRA